MGTRTKKPNVTTSDQQLLQQMRELDDLDKQALATLHNAFPRGREIMWDHGGYTQHGVVREVVGYTFRHARLRVLNSSTGKELLIDAHRIITGTIGDPRA